MRVRMQKEATASPTTGSATRNVFLNDAIIVLNTIAALKARPLDAWTTHS